MTAIVKDDEDSDQESTGQYRKWKSEPERNRNEKIHQEPHRRIRNDGIGELPDSRPKRGFLVFGDNVSPRWTGGFIRNRNFAHRKG